LIGELHYEHYFLTVADIVTFARSRHILCQGRGSAANSVVCFCIGVTEVDPARMSVLFERFISRERNEPPDIDIDFEHERREEVLQYLYAKYGRDRAALTGVVISYRPKSALRDVGKALGFSLATLDAVAREHSRWDGHEVRADRLAEAGLSADDLQVQQLLKLAGQLLGFPRHLSQHTGGFVLTRGLLCRMVPIENASMPDRTVIEWDKDDLDAIGLLKVDCLALGMLTALSKSLRFIGDRLGGVFEMQDIPSEDSATYDMVCRADTVGVFQIESRAQMSMLPRL
jgi:error-prone DNA polymerase